MSKKYYYMAACEVKVIVEDQVVSDSVNVLHTTTENRISPTDLGLMQQRAGLAYLQGMKDRGLNPELLKIDDVVIINIVKLGQFTDAEWVNTTPASVKKEMHNAKRAHLSVVETPANPEEPTNGEG